MPPHQQKSSSKNYGSSAVAATIDPGKMYSFGNLDDEKQFRIFCGSCRAVAGVYVIVLFEIVVQAAILLWMALRLRLNPEMSNCTLYSTFLGCTIAMLAAATALDGTRRSNRFMLLPHMILLVFELIALLVGLVFIAIAAIGGNIRLDIGGVGHAPMTNSGGMVSLLVLGDLIVLFIKVICRKVRQRIKYIDMWFLETFVKCYIYLKAKAEQQFMASRVLHNASLPLVAHSIQFSAIPVASLRDAAEPPPSYEELRH